MFTHPVILEPNCKNSEISTHKVCEKLSAKFGISLAKLLEPVYQIVTSGRENHTIFSLISS
jgi:hypothetical protein